MTTLPDRLFGHGQCAVCQAKVRVGLLMCGRHWKAVPKPLQIAVYRALDAFNADQADIGTLRAAQRAAVAAAEGGAH